MASASAAVSSPVSKFDSWCKEIVALRASSTDGKQSAATKSAISKIEEDINTYWKSLPSLVITKSFALDVRKLTAKPETLTEDQRQLIRRVLFKINITDKLTTQEHEELMMLEAEKFGETSRKLFIELLNCGRPLTDEEKVFFALNSQLGPAIKKMEKVPEKTTDTKAEAAVDAPPPLDDFDISLIRQNLDHFKAHGRFEDDSYIALIVNLHPQALSDPRLFVNNGSK
jgi:hypothetical protein